MATKKNPYELYVPTDYTAQYDAIAQARKNALDAAYNQQVNELNAQLPKIKENYDNQRNQTYRTARVTALGNNEGLAARGLAGNAYTAPMTGYSESSRIRETNALRNSLNALNRQQQGQEDTVATEIRQQGYARDKALADALAQIEQNRIAAQQSENQFGANYNLNVAKANQDYEAQQAENAYNKAIKELQLFGKIMTQESAAALGLPIGTSLAQYTSSGGSSSGSSGRSSGSSSRSSKTSKTTSYTNDDNNKNNKYDFEPLVDNRIFGTVKTNTIQNIVNKYGTSAAALNNALDAAVKDGYISDKDIQLYKLTRSGR